MRHLPVDDGLFELSGPEPLWVWVHTCPTPRCSCRTAVVIASGDGPAALLERGRPVREAWKTPGGLFRDAAAQVEGVVAFELDIDTADVSAAGTGADLNPEDEPRVRAVAERIDGEVLEAIGELWYRGKGQQLPYDELRHAPAIVLNGWTRGDLVAWDEPAEPARRDLYHSGGRVYEAIELYCPVPGCDCGDVRVLFEPRGGTKKAAGTVIIAAKDEVVFDPEPPSDQLRDLWRAFRARHPRRRERFSRRTALMKTIGARLPGVTSTPARRGAAVGRNDPCPCGSGKKYKKCCGG